MTGMDLSTRGISWRDKPSRICEGCHPWPNQGCHLPLTITGATSNALFDTGASLSCISEHLYKELMLPPVWQFFCLSVTSASGKTLKPLGTVKCLFD